MNDKMIEEMAKVIIQASCKGRECETCAFTQIVEVEDAPETCFCLKALYNAGYRKIPEGSVVLSKEEYSEYLILQNNFTNAKEKCEKLQADNERLYNNLGKFKESVEKETLEKIKLKPIECGEEIGYYYLDIRVTGKELIQRVYFNSDFIDGKVRKETAKEILDEIMSVGTEDEKWLKNEPFVRYVNKMLNKIEELAKQYGVLEE